MSTASCLGYEPVNNNKNVKKLFKKTLSNDEKFLPKTANKLRIEEDVLINVQPKVSVPTDAILIFQDDAKIAVNRQSFAHISPYFRAVFFGNFEEAQSKLVFICHKQYQTFIRCCQVLNALIDESIVQFHDQITLQDAMEMLDIASYLLMDPVLDYISDIIFSNVDASSLVLAFHKAENRYIPLANKLWLVIVRQFDKLIKNRTFLRLSEADLIKLINEESLNMERTDEVGMVRQWLTENDRERIRTKKLQKQLFGKVESIGFFETRTRLPNSIVIASGGWSSIGPSREIESLDSRADKWVRPALRLFEESRAYHAVVNTGDYLITVGGFNGVKYYSSALKFDLSTKECIVIASMYDKRCYVSCGVIDSQHIIAFGGYNNHERLRTAEILNISENQWKRIGRLGVSRSDSHCAVLNGIVYAIGGFDGSNYHQTVEYYQPLCDRWVTLLNPLNTRRSGVGAVALDGALFICGGFNGSERLRSAEFMDPREGIFHKARPMKHQRSNFGIENLKNNVVVAGGYDGFGTVAVAETYDFRLDKWIDLPELEIRRSALYLTTIDNHSIIEDLVTERF